jgi:hypothetical protein
MNIQTSKESFGKCVWRYSLLFYNHNCWMLIMKHSDSQLLSFHELFERWVIREHLMSMSLASSFDGFAWNLVFEVYTKLFRANINFVSICPVVLSCMWFWNGPCQCLKNKPILWNICTWHEIFMELISTTLISICWIYAWKIKLLQSVWGNISGISFAL